MGCLHSGQARKLPLNWPWFLLQPLPQLLNWPLDSALKQLRGRGGGRYPGVRKKRVVGGGDGVPFGGSNWLNSRLKQTRKEQFSSVNENQTAVYSSFTHS